MQKAIYLAVLSITALSGCATVSGPFELGADGRGTPEKGAMRLSTILTSIDHYRVAQSVVHLARPCHRDVFLKELDALHQAVLAALVERVAPHI